MITPEAVNDVSFVSCYNDNMIKKWYYYDESGKHYATLLGIKDGMAYIELESGEKCVGKEKNLERTLHPVIDFESPTKSISSESLNDVVNQESEKKESSSTEQNSKSSNAPDFFKEPGKATVNNSERAEQSKSHPHKTFRPPNFAKGTPNMRYNKYGSYGKW